MTAAESKGLKKGRPTFIGEAHLRLRPAASISGNELGRLSRVRLGQRSSGQEYTMGICARRQVQRTPGKTVC